VSRDPAVHLRHMRLCIERIQHYTQEGRDAFFADTRTQDAVIRNLEVIGQAARDLGVDRLAAEEPSMPWQSIAALRNVLAHQYLGVDLRLAWNIVERELPGLARAVAALLDQPDAAAADGGRPDG
jgi:uncharacterized protein with HEPN domain